MMLVTFYSYKGGVGRSLALANIACLMAEDEEHPQHVLVWDFDLEAPGQHQLFPAKKPQNYGFIDFAYEYVTKGEMPDIQEYIYESEIKGIYILPAGKPGQKYCEKLQQIDWLQFFSEDPKEPGPFFSDLINQLNQKNLYDYILIDSRTGLNDMAGICTQVFSELLVVLFRLSAQNIEGMKHLIPAIKNQLSLRNKENVEIIPIASQVGTAASNGIHEFRKQAEEIFSQKLEYIRFDEELVNNEKLFSLQEEQKKMWPCPPIIDDYKRICSTIREKNKNDTITQAEILRKLLAEGDNIEAVPILCNLLKRRPNISQTWNYLRNIYREMSEKFRREIEGIVNKVKENDPKNPFVYRWTALFNIHKAENSNDSKTIDAKNDLLDALKFASDSDKTSIYQEISLIESCHGELKDAVRILRKAIKYSPKNNRLKLDLVLLYMRMGAQYFGIACEELENIQEDLGGNKNVLLAYLWTFLGEQKKAKEAFSLCDKEVRQLVKVHMYLIEGRQKEACELAEKNKREIGLANLAEIYLCAKDFETVISLAKKRSKKSDYSGVKNILNLAMFIKEQGDISERKGDLISEWKEGWDFREMIMFRECCIRNQEEFVNRLEIIEEIVKNRDFLDIKTSGLGILERSARISPWTYSQGEVKIVIENR